MSLVTLEIALFRDKPTYLQFTFRPILFTAGLNELYTVSDVLLVVALLFNHSLGCHMA